MSNSRPSATLNIDLADLPMLVHGLSIMRATAMPGMCGSKRHHERADALYKQLVAQVPPVALKFDEYKFCDIILRVDQGQPFTVVCEKRNYWSNDYSVKVKFERPAAATVETKVEVVYESEDWRMTKETAEQTAKEMQELLDQIKPI